MCKYCDWVRERPLYSQQSRSKWSETEEPFVDSRLCFYFPNDDSTVVFQIKTERHSYPECESLMTTIALSEHSEEYSGPIEFCPKCGEKLPTELEMDDLNNRETISFDELWNDMSEKQKKVINYLVEK